MYKPLATLKFQFFPEANEVKFARQVFEGASFKLDYLTKPSFFEDFGFGEKVKIADRVKPDDQLFLVGYPYFNVNGSFQTSCVLVDMYIHDHEAYVRYPSYRNDCGRRALQGSCNEYHPKTDYIQWGT